MKIKLRGMAALLLATICRFALSLTLLFSGLVKAVDPMGMFHKLAAYLAHFGVMVADDDILLRVAVVALAVVEVALGLGLLLGMRRRTTAAATLLLMLAMTGITIYIYLYDPVPDCGCFGDALRLSHGWSLAKNVVLLLMSASLYPLRRYMLRFISERNQWITALYATLFTVVTALYSLHYLPPLDFTPFPRGLDLRQGYYAPTDDTPSEVVTFALFDAEGDPAVTDSILQREGLTLLLTLPQITTADDGCNDRTADLCDECGDLGIPFYGVVSHEATPADVADWTDKTGAAYPLLTADASTLRALVRSNPGLLLIADGTLLQKWSNNDLPSVAEFRTLLEASPSQRAAKLPSPRSALPRFILWLAVPLALIILADRLWIGTKFYKHNIFRKSLKNSTLMRKKIVAGNWKMNKTLQEGVALAAELKGMLAADAPKCDVVVCTPFIHLATVAGVLGGSVIGLGAENCADKASGAYTGEVSAQMVKSTGAQYVILGHSERRAYYHETPEILKEKVKLALENGLKVIFCIGEVLEEREQGVQNAVVKAQLEGSLFDLTAEEFGEIILAYEPVWAIGTGKTATSDQAEEMHAFIRQTIADKYGASVAEQTSILYGGSCKPSNAKELFSKPDVDGGLIGGAALKAADFKGIIDAWS